MPVSPSAASGPARTPRVAIAYGIPASLLAFVVLALLHPLLWFFAGLAAVAGSAVAAAALERGSPKVRAARARTFVGT